ncbi:hypothetical protein KI387_027292, partial [Taxus chinensis]
RRRSILDGAGREIVTGCSGYWMPSQQMRRTHCRGPAYCRYHVCLTLLRPVTYSVTCSHTGMQIGTLSDCQGSV